MQGALGWTFGDGTFVILRRLRPTYCWLDRGIHIPRHSTHLFRLNSGLTSHRNILRQMGINFSGILPTEEKSGIKKKTTQILYDMYFAKLANTAKRHVSEFMRARKLVKHWLIFGDKMSILNNAKDSIIMGLEDYSTSEKRRLISCARNLFAGILLLFKHKLSLLSPLNSAEALIKERVRPTIDAAGNLQWVGIGRKSVDVQQIKDRFESLNISVPWSRVKAINDFRNDVEHYYSNLSKSAMNALISNSFIVIRDFISHHLGLDPKEFLGEQAWNTLVSVSEVHEREKEECVKLLKNINWDSDTLASALVDFKCTNCGSDLITVREQKSDKHDNEFYCRVCDASWSFEDMTEHALSDYFGFELYLSEKEGGDAPLIQCPECLRDSYIIEEEYCPICETKAEHECQRCGMPIPPEEIDGSGYCSYCSHMMSKDD